ncbi:uncharacterized protein RCC_05601 [Ramularia collo-cygni]|uniref:Uncharacterized protein n=1 Tax=Ramularia collo-cygni TaxID=112498 RepID=A0A2D3V817_9PEZI|nr:uncharacterized protein RCC_05601 [Ramularia collo-cygni]CZT19746.1 uncharacterized protein RCC_05601 [Ramularia collo-cygni]
MLAVSTLRYAYEQRTLRYMPLMTAVEHHRGSDPQLRSSPDIEESDGGEVTQYAKGGPEVSKLDHENTHDDAVAEGIQDSSLLPRSGEPGSKGGLKGWISSKLSGGSKVEKHEGEMLKSDQEHSGSGNSGEGYGTYGSDVDAMDEPATDSGAAVRSVSEGPVPSFSMQPLIKEPERPHTGDSQDSQDSQGL